MRRLDATSSPDEKKKRGKLQTLAALMLATRRYRRARLAVSPTFRCKPRSTEAAQGRPLPDGNPRPQEIRPSRR